MKFLFFSACLVIAYCSCQSPNTENVSEEKLVKLTKIDSFEQKKAPTATANAFTLDYLMGKFDPSKHPDFTTVNAKHADRTGLYLRKDAYEAFIQMHDAAQKEGIQLTIRSATRNFANQKRIWEGKWTGQRILSNNENAAKVYKEHLPRALKILEYSSMPSTSRHHWGTDIDLNNFNNSYFESGKGLQEYQWLTANASKFGFCQVYTAKGADRPHGYNEEKWHWSYLPIAQQLTALAQQQMQDSLIQGFKGAKTAAAINVVQKYILGINKECFSD